MVEIDGVATGPRLEAASRRAGMSYLLQDLSRGRGTARDFFTMRFLATLLFRLSQVVGARFALGGFMVKQVNHLLTGADLAWQASVGAGLKLDHPTGVVWGPRVQIGENCNIQQGVTIGLARRPGAIRQSHISSTLGDSPRIQANVFLGAGCRVLGPVAVGNFAVVGANSVVLKDVPTGARAVGVPARILL